MKRLFTILAAFLIAASTFAQTGIGTTAPHASAQLEVSSTNKGFLPPRMTTEQRDNIANPATGLIIYNTTTNILEYKTASGWVSYQDTSDGTTVGDMQYWNGTAWVSSPPGTDGQVLKFISNVPTWADATSTNLYYEDVDGDLYGNANSVIAATSAPIRYVTDNTDCDDSDAIVTNVSQSWYIDADGDGYGVSTTISCERPTNGFLLSELSGTGIDDCDDGDFSSNPGAAEILGNNVDNNCNGNDDELVDIGEFALGGIVFYIYQSGDLGYVEGWQTGLVVALSNENNAPFGCSKIAIRTTSKAIGTGAANTLNIAEKCRMAGAISDYPLPVGAAVICEDLVREGYDDWFLPSLYEYQQMYINKAAINSGAIANGGSSLTNTNHWTSSEELNDSGYAPNLGAFNLTSWRGKDVVLKVRAVRAF
jgi:hypothetical protein